MRIKKFGTFNESRINESLAYYCRNCGERAEHEEIEENPDLICGNCGASDWADENSYEAENESEEPVNEEVNAIDPKRLGKSISIWGGDKAEEMFREAFKGLNIPKQPNTGDVTIDGNKVGFVDNFSGLVFTDMNWVSSNLEKIVAKTGFWYG